MTFSVTEIFPTLQGEGAKAGQRAVFVRFAGCNMWSGREEDRERDAARNGNQCARFCDTDFSPRMKMSGAELVLAVASAMDSPELVVLTGGEPSLQVTHHLVRSLQEMTGAAVAMETNGTADVSALGLDWVTCSPKQSAARLRLRVCDELKVVVPAYDPHAFADVRATHRYVQPEDGAVGSTEKAVAFVLENPGWRLSYQVHKEAGIR